MSDFASKQPSPEELQLAKVYAKAVWELAVKDGIAQDFHEEFQSLVHDVLDKHPNLDIFFQTTSISRQRRWELVEKVFAEQASPLLLNFLRTLNENDRLGIVRAILIRLEELWNESQGRVPVEVRSAVPLDDDQEQELRQMVQAKFGFEPDLKVEVDPELLGGLVFRVGDTVYDRSVRTNMKELRERILTRHAHEIQGG
ncbi:ATP synthase subunit delta, sodium ion specific [Planctomycetes bacterium Pan216]|uniref:ATP synthase subunit delta n=1 Tax=Kolteria novifilia TaxID=2527975 RepID=A0A518B8B9_9BACT|nr:ATP synthase subunit delta, sodium ion specific [Planctomycetes bacterium Pan216]